MEWKLSNKYVLADSPLYASAISKDASLVACGYGDKTIRVWRIREGNIQQLFVITPQEGIRRCEAMAFHPCKNELVFKAPRFGILDIETGREIYPKHIPSNSFAFGNDGDLIAIGMRSKIEIWRYDRLKRIKTLKIPENPNSKRGGIVYSLDFSSDGKLLASGSEDGTICVWKWKFGRLFKCWYPYDQFYGTVMFHRGNERLLTSSSMKRIICWDVETIQEIWSNHGGSCLVQSPDQKLIAVSSPNPVRILSSETGETLETLMDFYASHLAFSPDGESLLGGGNKLQIWQKIGTEDSLQKRIMNSETWFHDLVIYLIELGFFNDLSHLDESSQIAEITRRIELDFGGKPKSKPETVLDLLNVLAQDQTRVWWNDLESDVGPVNLMYEKFLQDMASISDGNFQPQDIKETWMGPQGPVKLSFRLQDQKIEIQPEYMSDYLDISILITLNKLIPDDQLGFEIYKYFDQTAYVVFLTAETKQRLERDLGWSFQDLLKT
jgi:hypothetical protein